MHLTVAVPCVRHPCSQGVKASPGTDCGVGPAAQDMLLIQLVLLARRRLWLDPNTDADVQGTCITNLLMMNAGRAALPYELTGDQAQVLDDILADMAGPAPMLRLLQGDVGTGKTAVAFLAMLTAAGSGEQKPLRS